MAVSAAVLAYYTRHIFHESGRDRIPKNFRPLEGKATGRSVVEGCVGGGKNVLELHLRADGARIEDVPGGGLRVLPYAGLEARDLRISGSSPAPCDQTTFGIRIDGGRAVIRQFEHLEHLGFGQSDSSFEHLLTSLVEHVDLFRSCGHGLSSSCGLASTMPH